MDVDRVAGPPPDEKLAIIWADGKTFVPGRTYRCLATRGEVQSGADEPDKWTVYFDVFYGPGEPHWYKALAAEPAEVQRLIQAVTDGRYWDSLPTRIKEAAQPFLPTADDVRGILG